MLAHPPKVSAVRISSNAFFMVPPSRSVNCLPGIMQESDIRAGREDHFEGVIRSRIAIIATLVLIGVVAGIGAFTFVYARGSSYLTNDPAACMNCHIMREHFDAWSKSSHKAVAVC